MGLTFAVLGAVRAWRDGVELDLGSVSVRTFLAALLVAPGRSLRTEELIDVLWPDRAPASAANSVHQYAARLRRVLEPEAAPRSRGEVLVRAGGGYRLDTDAVDLVRFRRLRAEAGKDIDRHIAALSLWQGSVAAAVRPESRLHPLFVALDAEHLEAMKEAADLAPAVPASKPVIPPRKAVPAQLPAPLPVFAGRRAELDQVLALIAPEEEGATVVISAIGGMAGVGKTTLAVRLGHLLAARFPDGQLYVNLRGFDRDDAILDPADALRGFLEALGVPAHRVPEGTAALAALFRSVLADRRVLIILDNARDAEQVRPLLPGSSGCLVLVTSRNRLTGLVATGGAHPLLLGVLSPEEARETLTRRLGEGRVRAEPEAVAEIVRLTAGLPLALAVVAARAAAYPHFGLSGLAAELRDSAGSLDAFADSDPATDARAVFSWSYRALTDAAARLFRLLSLHPGPEISVGAATALAGRPARGELAELSDANLLVEQSPGRFVFHDLLRDYARELSAPDDEATVRLLDHLLETATKAAYQLGPPPDGWDGGPDIAIVDSAAAYAILAVEWPVLTAAIERAGSAGHDDHVWRLAWTLERFHERGGHWHEWHREQEQAVRSARRLGDPAALAHALRGLGRALSLLRRYAEAFRALTEARELFAQVGNRAGEAYTHYCLGWVRTRQERHVDGLAEAEAALDAYRKLDHRRGMGDALNLIGWLHVLLGEAEAGLRSGMQALEQYLALGDERGQSQIWDTIAYAYHHLNRHAEAAEAYGKALRLFRAAGDRYNEACSWDRLGDSQYAAGDVEAAHRSWRTALGTLDDLDPPWAAEVRSKLE